jgi:hypothetical protein
MLSSLCPASTSVKAGRLLSSVPCPFVTIFVLPGESPLAGLMELARITPSDIERAKAAWKKHAPPEMKKLLDARLGL